MHKVLPVLNHFLSESPNESHYLVLLTEKIKSRFITLHQVHFVLVIQCKWKYAVCYE